MGYGVNIPLDVVVKSLNTHMKKSIEESARRHLNETLAPIFEGVVEDLTARIQASLTHWDEQRDVSSGKSIVRVQLVVNGQPRDVTTGTASGD